MNGFGHIEIPTTNFKKAKKFYGKVFGWSFEDVPDMDYVLFRAGTQPNGGLYELKKMPKKGQVNVYIEVGDIGDVTPVFFAIKNLYRVFPRHILILQEVIFLIYLINCLA